MLILKKVDDLKTHLKNISSQNKTIGFVPTMGALHLGHIALISQAVHKTDVCICSIFVNPIQFNNKEDFEKYPITLKEDIEKLEEANCTILFIPEVHEIYPLLNTEKEKYFNIGYLGSIIEGQYRPGHFQGVCTVLDIFFTIINPHHVFMGGKDYQQCKVVEKLIQISQYTPAIQLHIVATQREENGLALSSRNKRLPPPALEKAAQLYKALEFIKQHIKAGLVWEIVKQSESLLVLHGFTIDYVEIANAQNLRPVTDWDGNEKIVALVAATIGGIRLIDNLVLN